MQRASQPWLERGGEGSRTIFDGNAPREEMLLSGGKLSVKLLGGDGGAIPEQRPARRVPGGRRAVSALQAGRSPAPSALL